VSSNLTASARGNLMQKKVISILILIGLAFAVYWYFNDDQNPQTANENQTVVNNEQTQAPEEIQYDLNYEKDQSKWLTYNNTQLGFSFKYPPKYKDVSVLMMAGDTGEIFIGGAFVCLPDPGCSRQGFTFGGATTDYSAVKGVGYTFNGFEKIGGKYFVKDATGKSVEVSGPIIEVKAKNTAGYMIRGTDTGPGFPGYFGVTERNAFFNLRSAKFKGIIFRSDTVQISEEELLAILSTFTVK
jgi:hypothetical protein